MTENNRYCNRCGSEDIYYEIEGTFNGIRKPNSGEIEDLVVDKYKIIGSFCRYCGATNVLDDLE